MAAESNVITTAQMKKAREIDFVQRFTHDSLDKLTEVLGVTRRIPMMEGTTLYFYRTTGTLQNGAVTEGDIIPLSQYTTEKVAVGESTLQRVRKAAAAADLTSAGSAAAVNATANALMKDVQAGGRSALFTFRNKAYASGDAINGSAYTTATGVGLQAALADAWGQLQVKFEDD